MRLLISSVAAPCWKRPSSAGSVEWPQFAPDWLVGVGIWLVATEEAKASGSGDQLLANSDTSYWPVAKIPPVLKESKSLVWTSGLVGTLAPMSLSLVANSSTSEARFLLPAVVVMLKASFLPFLTRMPSEPLTQPSPSSSELALATSRVNLALVGSPHGLKVLSSGPSMVTPTLPTRFLLMRSLSMARSIAWRKIGRAT